MWKQTTTFPPVGTRCVLLGGTSACCVGTWNGDGWDVAGLTLLSTDPEWWTEVP